MNAEELRSKQRPLKEKYRTNPESALLIHEARGVLGPDVTFHVQTRNGTVEVGLHPATGGTGQQGCSADMLLDALAGCAGVTLGSVATAMGIEIRHCSIRAKGELDYRGTMAVSKEVPVGFRAIQLIFEIDSDADIEKLNTLIDLTERYCVVYQTIIATTPVKSSLERKSRN